MEVKKIFFNIKYNIKKKMSDTKDTIITDINKVYRDIETYINSISNNEGLKNDLTNQLNNNYIKNRPVITARSPKPSRLSEVYADVLILYKSIVNPPKPNNKNVVIENNKSDVALQSTSKKQKTSSTTLSASSADVPPPQQPQQQPQQQPLTITPATQPQIDALAYMGLHKDDIVKYGIVGNHSDYGNWWEKDADGNYKEILLNIVAGEEERFHKYYNDTYTPGQLAKTYNKIAESFIIQRCRGCDGRVIIDYLSFIRNNPQFALPTLLWIDTFHDFKEERLNKGKRNLNEIIDYLCYRIYGNHWGQLVEYSYIDNKGNPKTKFQTVEDCVVIGHHYNFDKMYQNSFFTFENISPNVTIVNGKNSQRLGNTPKVTGFHSDVKHTVLRPLFEITNFNGEYNTQEGVAKLLYKVSNVFINTTGGWEGDFLYAYLMYNFNFDMTKDGLIQNLRDVFWNEIKADKNLNMSIPYYAKDVDKGSTNFFKGTNVILPASLFDANRSNSSQKIEEFVAIPKTVIPLCNGYNFKYHYEAGNCNLTLSYLSNDNQAYKLCTTRFDNNSSCVDIKKRNNYPSIPDFIDSLSSHKQDQKQPLKEIDTSINKFLGLINSDNIYYTPNTRDTVFLEAIKDSVNKVYFDGNNCVKIPNGQGMSPIDCVSVVIGLLINPIYRNIQNGILHPLSPISCKYLDFWVALKRIGDFGQIMQCKQLGIPLFTNDNMQLLISMAACSSAVWTGDNSKVLWYDSNKDAILCNGLNPNLVPNMCNKTRIDISINTDNIIISGALLMLDQIRNFEQYEQLENDYKKQNIYNNFGVFLETIFNNIQTTITKLQNTIMPDNLKLYFEYRMQEQNLLLPNVLEGLVITSDFKDEIQNIKNSFNYINLISTLKNIISQEISNLDYVTVVNTINTLRKYLENKIQSQGNVTRYYDVIEEQLLTGQGMGNYTQDTETLLQTAANIIESKYVDKLTELNDIRNGCVIEVEMGGEKKEE
jgi:predicted transcriptional regulator